MPKSEPKWLEQGTQRDLGAELLQSIREMKAGLVGCTTPVHVHPVTQIRMNTGLSPEAFARLFGVSVRTLREWEMGRRNPSSTAKSLLKIAEKYPQIVSELSV